MAKHEDVKATLADYLKELHLPAFRASYEELARQAQQEALSYEQYLLELAERECQERRNKRIERLLRESRLPLEKSWPALDLKRLPAEGGAAGADAAGGVVRGPARERAGVRQPGLGQDAPALCDWPGTGAGGAEGVCSATCGLLVQELLVAKRDLKLPRVLKRLARLRGVDPGRPGLRAAEPGGDGGAVHAAGGAVRAGQRAADEQPAVLAVGRRSSRTR